MTREIDERHGASVERVEQLLSRARGRLFTAFFIRHDGPENLKLYDNIVRALRESRVQDGPLPRWVPRHIALLRSRASAAPYSGQRALAQALTYLESKDIRWKR